MDGIHIKSQYKLWKLDNLIFKLTMPDLGRPDNRRNG